MMDLKYVWIAVCAVAIMSFGGYIYPQASGMLGGTTNFDSLSLGETLTVTGASTLTGAATFTADATFNGGDGAVVITNSNTATSSIEVGCIQMTATSTATPTRIVMGSSGATTTHQGTAAAGVVAWQYGTCP